MVLYQFVSVNCRNNEARAHVAMGPGFIIPSIYGYKRIRNRGSVKIPLFHRRTRASYVYNGCLAWYNVVLTPRVHSSVKFVGLLLGTRAKVE